MQKNNHKHEPGNRLKYESKNPIERFLVGSFKKAVINSILLKKKQISSITCVGCGEGYLSSWIDTFSIASIKAFDISEKMIQKAKKIQKKSSSIKYYWRDLYHPDVRADKSDLVVCCEVLEHLQDPVLALKNIKKISEGYVIFSVPNEPLWRIMNMARFKYLRQKGNTPGHINHWTPTGFIKLVAQHFYIVKVKKPIPWTLVFCKNKNK